MEEKQYDIEKPPKPENISRSKRIPIREHRKASLHTNTVMYPQQEVQSSLKQFSFGDFSEDTNSTKSPELKKDETNQVFNFSSYKNQSFTNFQQLEPIRDSRKFSLEETKSSISDKIIISRRTKEEEKPLPPKNIKLSEVLNDTDIRDLFLKFCLSEFSSENLYFAEELKRFGKIEKKEDKMINLSEMYDKFLSDDALMQINVEKEPVLRIEKIIQTQDFDALEDDSIFKSISDEVTSLMKDTLSRFRESQEYDEYRTNFYDNILTSPTMTDSNNIPRKSVSDVLKNLFVRRDSTSSIGSTGSTRSKKRERKRGGSGSSVGTETSEKSVDYSGLADFKM
eukprot:gene6584-10747_t